MDNYNFEKLDKHMRSGRVYRREMLLNFSKAVDRDLEILVKKGKLQKLAGGLYYKPAMSAFGPLPPKDSDLVRCFLRDNRFLLYSWHQYNALGLGLTQFYNRVVVLNHKRHGVFKLGNKEFDFRRSNRGFPTKLTLEFLLVDLVNNLNELTEDTSFVKEKIQKNISHFDQNKVIQMAEKYGKVGTKHFFEEISHQHIIFTSSA
ncbi:MAG TPA: DUF6088 family protein [Gammaproteobacteria bacterium]|nr:DUF6088 family protein [Gammaproteobacteria bacterium]